MSEANPPDGASGRPSGEEPERQHEQAGPPGDHGDTGRNRYRRCACCCLEWLRRRWPGATQWLALGTWALVVVAFIGLQDGREALEKSQRAWLGPQNVAIVSPVTIGKGISLQIFYENSGREPGLNAIILHNSHIFKDSQWSDGTAAKEIIYNKDDCLSIRTLSQENSSGLSRNWPQIFQFF